MSEAKVPGSCFCGAVRFSAQLPSLFCGHCHCSMCRRSHGAGYVTWFAVPRDQLQPGDLVFFGTSGPTNHHVGIVVGPGIMIDAPHTGAYVRFVS